MRSRTLQIVEDDRDNDGKKDLTLMGPLGPMVTLYGWKQVIGYFCGLALSLVVAGLTVGTVVL